jgi:hypothetical protein
VLEDCYPANIVGCDFAHNSAPGFIGRSQYASSGTGGAIYVKFSAAFITDSSFDGNWVSAGGSQNSLGGAVSSKSLFLTFFPVRSSSNPSFVFF